MQAPNEPTTIASWVSTDSQPYVWHVDRLPTYRAGNGPFGAGQVISPLVIPRDISLANLTPLAASSASSAALGMLPTHMDWRMHTHCNIFPQTIEQGLGTIGFGLDIDFFINVDPNTGEQSMELFPPSNPNWRRGPTPRCSRGGDDSRQGCPSARPACAPPRWPRPPRAHADSEPLKILIFESSEVASSNGRPAFPSVNTAKLFAGGSTNNRNVLHAPAWADPARPRGGSMADRWGLHQRKPAWLRHRSDRFFLYRYSTTTYENFFYGVPEDPVDLMVLHAYIEKGR